MLSDAQTPRLERKFATALFADIAGSTALAEREDPEVVRSLIARAFAVLAEVIEDHGGMIEAYIGDAILALFGIPAVHEDDAERAVRAGLQMQRELELLNGTLAEEGRPTLHMRIGIEAGEVVVDLARVDGPRDRMLTGDAVNTASRLQAAAPVDRVLVGPQAHAGARDAIEHEPLGALTLKGKSEPVHAWLALAAKASRRAERAPTGLSARLVGRDEELAMLLATFERVRSEKRPELVTIIGTAGVGKSRLSAEFVRSLQATGDGARVVRGQCRSYGNVSYSALADAVKELCWIRDDDPPEVVHEKAGQAVRACGGDASIVPALEALVAAAPESVRREELFDAWRAFLERITALEPLVLLLEDIHWADDGLLDFAEHLADWADGPLLLVTLARPDLLEARPGWGGGIRTHPTIHLDPLTPDETHEMVEDLLSARHPNPLHDLLVDRCEGNPLFVEELVRSLIDRGAIERGERGWTATAISDELELPRSIHGVIASRIDALTPDEKSLVQDAAVVGRDFWLGALEQLSQRDRETSFSIATRLRGKEIISAKPDSTFSGELEFAFRHVLIRDVAYDSLPKAFRADKHVAVARWAEEQAAERRDEIAELLATHYAEALRYLRELGERADPELELEAYRWSRAAGERSLGLWQHREAARWFRSAVDVAEGIGLAQEERAQLWESYARAAEGVEPYATIAAGFERALEIYRSLRSDADAGRVEAWLAHVAFQFGDDEGVVRWARQAIAHLEPLGDGPDLALALIRLGWYHHRKRRDEEAEPLLRRANAIADRVGDPVVCARAMVSLGMLVYRSGRGEEGMRLLESGLQLARGSRDLPLLLWGLLIVSEALEVVASDYRRAEALVREGLELAARAGYTEQIAWMQGNLADYLVDQGRLDEAEEPAREGLKAARSIAEVPRIGYSLLMNAYLRILRLDVEGAEALLAELRPLVEQTAESYHEGWADLIEGLIVRARGDEARTIEILASGASRTADRLEPWAGQLLLLECVRSLVRAGRASEAGPFHDGLERLARVSAASTAFLAWADGLLDPDPASARERLEGAVEQLRTLGRATEHGRCLIDLAEAERRLGRDPTATLSEGRAVLEACGAALFIPDLEEVERQRLASS